MIKTIQIPIIILYLLFLLASPLAAAGESGFALVNSLPLTRHPEWGRDLPGASRMHFFKDRIYLSRRFGLHWVSLDGKKTGYIALPEAARAAKISSFCIRKGVVWVVTGDGLLFRRDLQRRWVRVATGLGARAVVQCGAAGIALGAGRAYYQRITGRFPDRPLFTFPETVPLRIRSILDRGFWKYLGSDLGLFRVNTVGEMSWEGLGTRSHLAKTHVQDMAPGESYLVLATSRVQSARFPANVKLTGYGTFYYNYFQNRWEREAAGRDPLQERFIRLNRHNTTIPPGGLWVYTPPLPDRLSTSGYARYSKALASQRVIVGRESRFLVSLMGQVYRRSGDGYQLVQGSILRRAWVLARAFESLGMGEQAIRYGSGDLDFLRVIRLARGDYLAATRQGLFRFRKQDGQWALRPVARYTNRYIDDILMVRSHVAVLSGDHLYLSELRVWTEAGTAPEQGRLSDTVVPGRGKMVTDGSEVERFRNQMEHYLRRGKSE